MKTRSLSGFAHFNEENAEKRSLGAFSTSKTPKGAHKSEIFEANSRKNLQVQQAPSHFFIFTIENYSFSCYKTSMDVIVKCVPSAFKHRVTTC